LLVDVGFVEPTEGGINDIRAFLVLERVDFLRSKVGEVLGGVNLYPLTPHIGCCVHRLHPLQVFLRSQGLSLLWFEHTKELSQVSLLFFFFPEETTRASQHR